MALIHHGEHGLRGLRADQRCTPKRPRWQTSLLQEAQHQSAQPAKSHEPAQQQSPAHGVTQM